MIKFEKKCPKCECKMEYTNRGNLIASIKNNRMCKDCGIKHRRKVVYTVEMRKARSDRVKGNKNPMYGRTGKSHPMYGMSGDLSPTFGNVAWNRGIPFPPEIRRKMKIAKKSIGKWKGKSNPNYGNHSPLSEEHRRKVRLAHIRRVEQLRLDGYILKPNFNIGACKLIDEYGRKNGYNFQHAMNGGEHLISHLGYWVDGYDKEKNVVVDFYEDNHHHYNKDGTMKEKDLRRIDEIKRYLNCQFIVLEEKYL